MCGGAVGKVIGSVTDAIGLTDTKKDSKGLDAEAAAKKAQDDATRAANDEIAARRKRTASTMLASAAPEQKNTLGG